MPRSVIPNTNVSINTHYKTIFGLGVSNLSLNTAGERILPRVNAGGTAMSEIRNKTVYLIPEVEVYDTETDAATSLGVVQITSPFTSAASNTLSDQITNVLDDSTHSTFTIEFVDLDGGGSATFIQWTNQAGTLLAGTNPATITLTNSTFFNATKIQARISSAFGGGGGPGGPGGI